MKQNIKLSKNELWSLLTKVFEALFGHSQDYYDMARAVLWLESHGLNGVERLINALPALEQKNLPQPEWSNGSVLDGAKHSLFGLGRIACDLVIAKAAETQIAHLELKNVTEPEALVGLLPYTSGQGFALAVFWSDGVATIEPYEEYPNIFEQRSKAPTRLVCAQTLSSIKLPEDIDLVCSSEELIACYKDNLETGIAIKQTYYDLLNAVANRILVTSSEASRRGAGE